MFEQLQSNDTIARDDVAQLLAAIGKPEQLAAAYSAIGFVKKYSFEASPEGRVSWDEFEQFLRSDGRDVES